MLRERQVTPLRILTVTLGVLAAIEEDTYGPGGDRVLFHEVDVRDAKSVRDLMAAAAGHFGRVDTVVANTGASAPGPITAADPQEWAQWCMRELPASAVALFQGPPLREFSVLVRRAR